MKNNNPQFKGQEGAALMMVLVASLLLGTASIALLSAVGASAANNTDALSEAKAYWAAESGIQRTVDILRNALPEVSYSQAHNSGNMAAWLGSSNAIAVGSEASYTVDVRDPDNTAAGSTFTVTGLFEQADGSYAATRTFSANAGANTTTISFVPPPTTTVTFPMNTAVSFGQFRVVSTDPAAPLSDVDFKLLFNYSAPVGVTRTIRGKILADGNITWTLTSYQLLGSTISICGTNTCPTALPLLPSTTPATTAAINGTLSAREPIRLVIRSTGYGPNNSKKVLEAIIQKSFVTGFGIDNALTFVGRTDCINFQLGSSAQLDINGGTSPSVGVPSTYTLNQVNTEVTANNTNGTITPAPDVYSGAELPPWMQTVEAMDTMVRQFRQTAMNSGRYFTSDNVSGGWGNFDLGTGITFCEGNCTMGGNTSGGGILVVTGTFTTNGAPSFKGLVLVTGSCVIRNGGGQENFIGGTVIAPYNPNNLAAGWGCPCYNQNGGAGNTVALGLDNTVDGTEAVNNFVIGVAEK
jgi:hypothetical protein